MIVTTQPPATILPLLRDSVKFELAARGVLGAEAKRRLQSCLERVSVSRVFDLEGLYEVLGDLDILPERPESPAPPDMNEVAAAPEPLPSPPKQSTPSPQPETLVLPGLRPARTEIADSDDEDVLSSSSSELSPPPSSIRSPTPLAAASPEKPDSPERSRDRPEERGEPALPGVILVTHFHSLMTALFTRRDRQSAHNSLQNLSSHLRYLSRSLLSSPLILLLNSTSSSKEVPKPPNPQDGPPPPPMPPNSGGSSAGSSKTLDPTLRSIFNPPPLNIPGHGTGQAAAQRNKPTFGLVFSQLLDLHLLCTRIPRDKEDAEKLYAAPDGGENDEHDGGVVAVGGAAVRYVWAVEVLLDEIGVWEASSPGAARKERSWREQRWAAIDVKGGRVVDAFEATERRVGEVLVGLGGPGCE